MGDVLKDLMEAANNRIRSPFLGSILFVFLVVNWRPLFNLLFGDSPVLVRLAHFDNVTTWVTLYLVPIVGGVVFALASPWVQHVGALWAKQPNAKLKNLQDEVAHQHQIAEIRRATELEETRAAEEDARERRKIEAAKREQEAEEIGGEELREEVAQDRPKTKIMQSFPLLTDEQNQLMIQAAQDTVLHLPTQDSFSAPLSFGKGVLFSASADTPEEAQANQVKRKVADKLVGMGLLSRSDMDGPWRITAKGKAYVKHLSQQGNGSMKYPTAP
ncbi:hypothetical protein XMM379_002163 [Aliiroseovarius sp. xm-m-379]|uniref:hypothetical protein n=1 Tax=unclassified Aliiroseovarius TaxID=2623558 RepID=UPI0015681A27|nr:MULTISPECIES: hypothetical protein [unclassified Aliiroseovarius]NRP13890.1 hypothetical protein [Aliiroseovarius sp. xm-d-517]NRP25465.1 hypothetical protein [Aliiroseovarius sp. xm-m-379]NRP29458.1 hypothetical protein [Aliiroseovarius sp. xm-m-314]NRP34264.1 hypothetical protein [Aliiroseovarius sp. xm-a-104]NRP41777.1 hypothetical protein [Aliiroseovarius sp. xm-m-339-2]